MGTLLAHGAPAGGAALEEAVAASVVGLVLVAVTVGLGWAHRTGRWQGLRRLADLSERLSGLPAWAALPGVVTTASLLTAVFGFYWDVSTHIDNGRDPGPFANPAHWFILVGLVGIALAGAIAVTLGSDEERRPRTAVRIREGWTVPVGGVLLLTCGVVALLGFPLDDAWHRLFGQDVTLWGPTHIQMVGGASLATLAQWTLFVEAQRTGTRPASPALRWLTRSRDVGMAGAFLLGLSTLQGEFDFGVPQFLLLYHPVLLALAASVGLVVARIRLGRGGALGAVGFFVAVRVVLLVLIGPVLGRIWLFLPLYLVEALIVEAVAARVGRDRQLTLGAWSGLGIGTVGLVGEWAWTQVAMPIPWPAGLLPEAIALGLPTAVAGGLLGGAIGRALAPSGVARQRGPAWLAAAVAATIVVALAWPLSTSAPDGVVAHLRLEDTAAAGGRHVDVTVSIEPTDAVEDATLLHVLAWQGADWTDRASVVDALEPVAPGTWRTTEPIPVDGEWKALVRYQRGRVDAAAPIAFPEDQPADAEAIPAASPVTRPFVASHELFRREAREAPGWVWSLGYLVLAAIVVAWIGVLWWGLDRLDGDEPVTRRERPRVAVSR